MKKAILLSVLCLSVGCGQPGPSSPQVDGQSDQTLAESTSDIAGFIESEVRQRLPQLSVEPSEEQLAAITPFAKYYASYVERIESLDAAQTFRSDFSSRLDGCLAQPSCTLDRLWVQAQLSTAEVTREALAESVKDYTPGTALFAAGFFGVLGEGLRRLHSAEIKIGMSRFISDLMEDVPLREGKLSPAVKAALLEQHPEVVAALRNLREAEANVGSPTTNSRAFEYNAELHASRIDDAEKELLKAVTKAGEKIRGAANISGESKPVTMDRIREIQRRHGEPPFLPYSRAFYHRITYGVAIAGVGSAIWDLVKISEEHYVWVPEQTSDLKVNSDGSVSKKPQHRQSALDRR